ncbi:hypothetical protein [Halofilum ochraceum]|uniref:hypothetical protein n=1 Tax=Halofilum ochraceum TaxID=1611323 RepID=UPI0008DAF859|nr:hypothetical protein [Halofilum ochraceum]
MPANEPAVDMLPPKHYPYDGDIAFLHAARNYIEAGWWERFKVRTFGHIQQAWDGEHYVTVANYRNVIYMLGFELALPAEREGAAND